MIWTAWPCAELVDRFARFRDELLQVIDLELGLLAIVEVFTFQAVELGRCQLECFKLFA